MARRAPKRIVPALIVELIVKYLHTEARRSWNVASVALAEVNSS